MIYALCFIFGVVIGSFLNVCIYRYPLNISLLRPGSFCPKCGSHIPFYLNVPLLAYLFLGGKCHACSDKISPRYFIVELVSGVFTVFTYMKFGFSGAFIFYTFLIYFMLVISFIDLSTHLIYNKFLLFLLGGGGVINLIFAVKPWPEAVFGLLAGGGALLLFAVLGQLIFRKESMGMGDVKLAAVLGFFLGWKMILLALLLGFVYAMMATIIATVINIKNSDGYIPMAPFLAFGALTFVYWGPMLLNWYWGLFQAVQV